MGVGKPTTLHVVNAEEIAEYNRQTDAASSDSDCYSDLCNHCLQTIRRFNVLTA